MRKKHFKFSQNCLSKARLKTFFLIDNHYKNYLWINQNRVLFLQSASEVFKEASPHKDGHYP